MTNYHLFFPSASLMFLLQFKLLLFPVCSMWHWWYWHSKPRRFEDAVIQGWHYKCFHPNTFVLQQSLQTSHKWHLHTWALVLQQSLQIAIKTFTCMSTRELSHSLSCTPRLLPNLQVTLKLQPHTKYTFRVECIFLHPCCRNESFSIFQALCAYGRSCCKVDGS